MRTNTNHLHLVDKVTLLIRVLLTITLPAERRDLGDPIVVAI
jgi:hypothetical protein